MSKCFYHLTHLPSLPETYSNLATETKYLGPGEHNLLANITFADCTKFEETPLFDKLKQDFDKVKPQFFRNDPNTFLHWHRDSSYSGPRECCINFALSVNPGAMTMYRTEEINPSNFKIEVCDYTLLAPTLFNTQVTHSVVNPSDSYRYILSIGLWGKPFNEAKEYFANLKLDSYY